MIIKRGGIYLAAQDPVIGNEIAKTRPVVVMSNDKNKEFIHVIRVHPCPL
ncbi:MAG: type II toxin-antitoxin system PemK/MazF family toxin [Deltaproteobacteria bacterium]|nr:type II toxin-antitoxin system PemK/MazF family toxin [Deltaproteobacteria bacterium]